VDKGVVMRSLRRFFVIAVVALCTAGPLLAAPIGAVSGAHLTTNAPAPHAPTGPSLNWLYLVAPFAAIRIKDTGVLAKKFTQRASAAAPDYADGVKASGADWENNTKASGDNYAAGVQAGIANKQFEKGVAAAGAAKFVMKASTLGAQRYPSGVAAAEGDWARGAQPYLDTLKNLQLPPRRPKGDPGNQARANAVGAALRAQKVGK
jgi:hypothetical protein